MGLQYNGLVVSLPSLVLSTRWQFSYGKLCNQWNRKSDYSPHPHPPPMLLSKPTHNKLLLHLMMMLTLFSAPCAFVSSLSGCCTQLQVYPASDFGTSG